MVLVFRDDTAQCETNDALEQSRRQALKALKRAVRARNRLRRRKAFNRGVLNSMIAHIAVIDRDGTILEVNESWRKFAAENDLPDAGKNAFIGANYFEAYNQIHTTSEDEALQARAGIKRVLDGTVPNFSLEFRCHSPSERRWFVMSVTPLSEAVWRSGDQPFEHHPTQIGGREECAVSRARGPGA